MKRRLINILLVITLLTGCVLLLYPMLSNQWNNLRQKILINNYETIINEMEEADFSREWEAARAYNNSLEYNALYTDVFEDSDIDLKDTEYWKVLNVANDGVMGYLSIPKINIKLAIYHSAKEEVLQTGVGHINGTMLPIGGNSIHTVLSAHRGLPSARLFTDIDQLQKGDMIYIHVLDETLAYEVDQVLDMIEKNDAKTLGKALSVEDGTDRITLFTCTPYGINSHRLLVRGTRVPYAGEEVQTSLAVEGMLKAVQNYEMLYIILALASGILIVLIMKQVTRNKRKR